MTGVELLQDRFLERKTKNPSYSLRSFARDLGISHTYLSLIFSGKRKLSPSLASQIGLLLGLKGNDLQTMIEDAVERGSGGRSVNSKLKKSVESRRGRLSQYQDLQIEYSKVLSSWYSFAILEATYLKDCVNDPRWFAKRLGITHIESRATIHRLLKLEMLEVVEGRLSKVNDFVRLPTKKSLAPMRTYYGAVFDKAKESLADTTDQAFTARQISGGTLAIKKSQIKAARERLKNFQDEFIAEFASKNSDEVYQVGFQFFPLTKKENLK